MMFRCFLRPRGRLTIPPAWLPSQASSGSRGIKLSKLKLASTNNIPPEYATSGHVVQGRTWLNQLTRNNIGHYKELQRVTQLKNVVQVKFSPRHLRKFSDDMYFTETGHAFAEAVVRRYLRDHKEKPLWYITTIPVSEKPIVRGKFKYRAHAALKQALSNAGYDAAGRRIAESKGIAQNRAAKSEDLFGTVEILTFEPKEIHKVPFTTLRGFFEQAVGMLEQQLGGKKTGGGGGDSRSTGRGGNERPRVQNQRPRRQAGDKFTERADRPGPGDRGPDAPRRGTPYSRGNGVQGSWASGDLGKRQIQHSRGDGDSQSVNAGFSG